MFTVCIDIAILLIGKKNNFLLLVYNKFLNTSVCDI